MFQYIMNLFRKKKYLKVDSSNTVWSSTLTLPNTVWDAATLTGTSEPAPVKIWFSGDTIRIVLSDGKAVTLKEYIESVIDEKLKERQ